MKKNWVITVGRQYCSGGSEAAKLLAEKLGYKYLDKAIIDETADFLDLAEDFIKKVEDKPGHFFKNPLHWYLDPDEEELSVSDAAMIFHAQSQIIKQYADEGNCVIVGRCADYILADYPNLLRVFFCADMDKRIQRCADMFDLSKEHAEHDILHTDRNRARYYNHNTSKRRWGSKKCYDLYIDLGELGIEGGVDTIIEELEKRESEL